LTRQVVVHRRFGAMKKVVATRLSRRALDPMGNEVWALVILVMPVMAAAGRGLGSCGSCRYCVRSWWRAPLLMGKSLFPSVPGPSDSRPGNVPSGVPRRSRTFRGCAQDAPAVFPVRAAGVPAVASGASGAGGGRAMGERGGWGAR
jgi:hypothetical protein